MNTYGEGPLTPVGIKLHFGQRWRENDKRHTRIVTVIGWSADGERVQIQAALTTWAALRRFNGRSHGYSPERP